MHSKCDHGHLDLGRRYLLADEFRDPAYHEPGQKDSDDGEQQHAEKAGADTSDDHLVEHHIRQQHAPA
jgi:hypothetical protein